MTREAADPWQGRVATGLILVGACAVVAAPLWATHYLLNVLIIFAINAVLVLGYRAITAMGGWSFAHAAIMGLGAYTFAILTTKSLDWPFLPALVAAVAVSSLFAGLIAVPVLRTRNFYFFLSTFAAGEALRQCFVQFSSMTGGNDGIAFIERPAFGSLSLDSDVNFYYFVLVLVSLTLIGLWRLDRSRFGGTLVAVRQNESLSESLGFSTYSYRIAAFVLGSGIAGAAGALSASFNGIINPSDFGSAVMFKVIAAAIIGGVSSLWGPLLGLAYLTVLEEAFRRFEAWIPLFWGVSVIAVVLYAPGGLEGLIRRQAARLRRRRGGP